MYLIATHTETTQNQPGLRWFVPMLLCPESMTETDRTLLADWDWQRERSPLPLSTEGGADVDYLLHAGFAMHQAAIS